MANKEQLSILSQGIDVWNKWRDENRNKEIDLSGIDLTQIELSTFKIPDPRLEETRSGNAIAIGIRNNIDYDPKRADLTAVNLKKCNFTKAHLCHALLVDANLSESRLYGSDIRQADLSGTNLSLADFRGANLQWARLGNANLYLANFSGANLHNVELFDANLRFTNFHKADLSGANLSNSDLYNTNLEEAKLIGANLMGTSLIETKIRKAIISKSKVYGINVWDLDGEFEEQRDLIITRAGQEGVGVSVDNIEVAQFIYLILNNEKVRHVINTITSKSVLILGRFAIPERKSILDTLRNKLREYDLLPIVFDFDRPSDKDFTETIKTLAGLSYFVIADVTNPKSSPLELQATVPDYQIPFVPIIQEGENPFAMMVDLQKKYNWVLNTVSYDSEETLMKALKPLIIDPAMKKRQELRIIKALEPEIISAKDFLAKGKE